MTPSIVTPQGPSTSSPPPIFVATTGQGSPSGSGGASPSAGPVQAVASGQAAPQAAGSLVVKTAAPSVVLGQQPGAPNTTQFHGDAVRTRLQLRTRRC